MEHNRTDVAFVPLADVAARTAVVAVTRANEQNALVAAFLANLRASRADHAAQQPRGEAARGGRTSITMSKKRTRGGTP
jgi:hypothetical protein